MSVRKDSSSGTYGETSHLPQPGRGRGWGTPPIADSKPRPSNKSFPQPASDVSKAHRRMDLMASVSRSSGLEKDGDDLKDYNTQEEYRNFIDEKTNDVLELFTRRGSESEDERRRRTDKQENLLILFRKLREGVSSSSRRDNFALEAYQTSLYYSIVFESPKQTTSIILHLFPHRPTKDLKSSDTTWPSPSIYTILGSLLHNLVAFYPSQSFYHQHLACIPERLLPKNSQASSWLLSVSKSLRRRDYARFAILSRKSSISQLLDGFREQADSKDNLLVNHSTAYKGDDLAMNAVLFLVNALRQKASDTAWQILRSAYRELWCDQAFAETKTWLQRTLTLDSVESDGSKVNIETWLEVKASSGHVRRKEGAGDRWIVCKAR